MPPGTGDKRKISRMFTNVNCTMHLVWTNSNLPTIPWKCIYVTTFRAAPWTVLPPFTVESDHDLNYICSSVDCGWASAVSASMVSSSNLGGLDGALLDGVPDRKVSVLVSDHSAVAAPASEPEGSTEGVS